MKHRLIVLPALNANDDSAELVTWLAKDRAAVKAGETLALLETTKTAFEVVTEVGGYCAHLFQAGDCVPKGEAIAVILEKQDQNLQDFLATLQAERSPKSDDRRWTKKAEIVAKKLGLNIDEIALRLGRLVTESDVVAVSPQKPNVMDLVDEAFPVNRRERVLLIGGGGGGGVITLDAIARTQHQRAIGILDNNARLHGKTLMGVPILGANSQVEQLWSKGVFDAAIVVVTGDLMQREILFEELQTKKIPSTNVIDPSVEIRTNVKMGTGNLIMANGFLAACVSVGNNNFFASHVCIEHHSQVGNHCTMGPRTTTSGAVVIGDRVKFGMGILVEPYLTIGDDALLPSGSIITTSIPKNTVVKLQNTQLHRTR